MGQVSMGSLEVRLFATFREGRAKVVAVDWRPGLSGQGVMEALGIAPNTVAIYLVNGKNADPSSALQESDIVSLFPPVGGG
jgi:sulfur carrier protein